MKKLKNTLTISLLLVLGVSAAQAGDQGGWRSWFGLGGAAPQKAQIGFSVPSPSPSEGYPVSPRIQQPAVTTLSAMAVLSNEITNLKERVKALEGRLIPQPQYPSPQQDSGPSAFGRDVISLRAPLPQDTQALPSQIQKSPAQLYQTFKSLMYGLYPGQGLDNQTITNTIKYSYTTGAKKSELMQILSYLDANDPHNEYLPFIRSFFEKSGYK